MKHSKQKGLGYNNINYKQFALIFLSQYLKVECSKENQAHVVML